MRERGCFPTTILKQLRRLCRPRHPYAVPRTSLQCVCTRRRNCIAQLSPSREYALRTVDFPARKLCHNRTDPLPTRQRFQTKNRLRKLVPSTDCLLVNTARPNRARDGFVIHDQSCCSTDTSFSSLVSVGALPPVKSMDQGKSGSGQRQTKALRGGTSAFAPVADIESRTSDVMERQCLLFLR
jgi:hypothetical protein